MIPDFAAKMLSLNNMRNSDFSWGRMQQKASEDIKNELCANRLVQPYKLQKEATVSTDASEETIGGAVSQEGNPVLYVSRKLTPVEQNYLKIEREALKLCLWSQDGSNSFLGNNLPYRRTANHSNMSLHETKRS